MVGYLISLEGCDLAVAAAGRARICGSSVDTTAGVS